MFGPRAGWISSAFLRTSRLVFAADVPREIPVNFVSDCAKWSYYPNSDKNIAYMDGFSTGNQSLKCRRYQDGKTVVFRSSYTLVIADSCLQIPLHCTYLRWWYVYFEV